MVKVDHTPVWTRPGSGSLAGWPVCPRVSAGVRCRLPLRAEWSGPETSAAEWATVAFLADAAPAANLDAWVEGPLTLAGFPVSPPVPSPTPRLLEWEPVGRWPALADRLRVADVHLFVGLAATMIDDAPALMRLYVSLASNETSAWNVVLAIESACPPGCDADLVAANDHVRAAATFGSLGLGSSAALPHAVLS